MVWFVLVDHPSQNSIGYELYKQICFYCLVFLLLTLLTKGLPLISFVIKNGIHKEEITHSYEELKINVITFANSVLVCVNQKTEEAKIVFTKLKYVLELLNTSLPKKVRIS